MIITIFSMAFIIYASAHSPTAIIIPAHQFVAPRYIAVGGDFYNPLVHPTSADVWPHVHTPTELIYEHREIADFLGIPAFYWVALFFLVVAVLVGGLLFLILFIVRRQQERRFERNQRACSNL
ncbi:hypothetical protein RB195_021402 [Necator americanus]